MIKIDSEGAEFEILSKSKKTIAKFRPIIYCEVTRKKDEIIKFFKKENINCLLLLMIEYSHIHKKILMVIY